MVKLRVLLLLAAIAWAGTIVPDDAHAIKASRSNAGETSTYSFKFRTATRITDGPSVAIIFPEQYASGLGISTCSGYHVNNTQNPSVSCTVTANTVNFPVTGNLDAGIHEFKVMGVKNPTTSGGTASFKVRALSNNFVVDDNDTYINFGITPVPATISTMTLTSDGDLYAA
jgi:hypothetical protein